MPPPFADVTELLMGGVRARAFPAAAIEVGGRSGALWRRTFGALSYDEGALPTTANTIFDLASLTKVIATASLAMQAVDEGRLRLEDRVADRLAEWTRGGPAGGPDAKLPAHPAGGAARP